jgi:hypothetical protein
MRLDLIKTISESRDITNVIILTHNIDFIFLQGNLIRQLRKIGHPTLTVFADANRAIESFQRQGRWIEGIGKRYRVVPVAMNPGFCFHPKAVLLSSQAKATLLVGSGNLGFGGWRENAEVWIRFDTDVDGGAPFAAFYQYLVQVLKRVPLNETVAIEVEEAFDPRTRTWVKDLGKAEGLIGKVGDGKSLLDRLKETLREAKPERLTICAPYYDPKGEMVLELASLSQAPITQVLIQGRKTGLLKNAASSMPGNVSIQPVDFRREGHSSFLHAKFYALEGPKNVTVLAGSANCSIAAFGIPEANGNAELIAIQRMTPVEFEESYLKEIEFLPGKPELQEELEQPKQQTTAPVIQILAARFEGSNLYLAYNPRNIDIKACLIDEAQVNFTLLGDGKIVAHLEQLPNHVVLEGVIGNQCIRSPVSWIDYEHELRSSSRERSLAAAIHSRVRSGEWDINAWADILELFYQNLQYMPQRKAFYQKPSQQPPDTEKNTIYSEEDIFTDGYGLPVTINVRVPRDEDERILGLRQLILRWFGGWRFEEEDETAEEGDTDQDNGDDEETVDHIERILPPKIGFREPATEERDFQRAQKVINKVFDTMTNPTFLKERSPEQLAVDISIASTLLRAGLSEEWIGLEEFLRLTHLVWSVLFFTNIDSEQDSVGWIEYRYQSSTDPEDFSRRLSNIDLSVALAAWALAVPPFINSPETSLFALACAKSIGRLPWLWHATQLEEIGDGLQKVLIHTGAMKPNDNTTWLSYRTRWKQLIQNGYVLGKLEKILTAYSLAEVRNWITTDEIKKGELLWQGRKGLCVAGGEYRRSWKGIPVTVLCLQSPDRYKKFHAEYLVPLNGLMSTDIIRNKLTEAERLVLNNFLDQLHRGFQSTS